MSPPIVAGPSGRASVIATGVECVLEVCGTDPDGRLLWHERQDERRQPRPATSPAPPKKEGSATHLSRPLDFKALARDIESNGIDRDLARYMAAVKINLPPDERSRYRRAWR